MISDTLYTLINESAYADSFLVTDINHVQVDRIKQVISDEMAKSKLRILKACETPSDILSTITIITDMSNTTYRFFTKLMRLQNRRSLPLLRALCLWVINEMEQFILFIINGNCFTADYQLSNYQIGFDKVELKLAFRSLENYHNSSVTGNELSNLIFLTMKESIFYKRSYTKSEVERLRKAMLHLQQFGLEGEEALLNFVVLYDFCDSRIYHYWTRYLEVQLETYTDLNDRQKFLLQQRRRLENLMLTMKQKKVIHIFLLGKNLLKYVAEHYRFLNDSLKLTIKYNTLVLAESRQRKFLVGLPVAQYALFIRLQLESGILNKENIGAVFSFFSDHFYTANTKHISAESLQKKSTDVEFSTAQKIKGQLISMINWLNKNYNLSNFN